MKGSLKLMMKRKKRRDAYEKMFYEGAI